MKVESKKDMYRMLAAGRFGNTNPAFYNLTDWAASFERGNYPLWGIRSLSAFDKRLALDVPSEDVQYVIARDFYDGFSLSPMVDRWLTFRAEVYDAPGGLIVFGVEGHGDVKWRQAFNLHGRQWVGVAARGILRSHMWPADYDDLGELMDNYPGHVVEVTCCTRAVGTVPHRNTIVWEVRCTDGSYEKW